MRRLIALIVVLALTLVLTAPPAAEAHRRFGGPHVGVGLAAFGLFSLLAAPFYLLPRPVYAYPPAYPYGYAPTYAPTYVEQAPVVERQVYMSAPPAAAPAVSPAPYPYASQVAAPPPAAAAPAASHPTVVQYAHGRYELRGDGIQTAYAWVWVPTAPPPPPPPPPPAPSR